MTSVARAARKHKRLLQRNLVADGLSQLLTTLGEAILHTDLDCDEPSEAVVTHSQAAIDAATDRRGSADRRRAAG